MRLASFVYTSRACVPFRVPKLVHLRLVAENFNDRYDVTGLLLYEGARFAQMVEGPTAGVEHVAERILSDLRHTELDVAKNAPANKRRFFGWSMIHHPADQQRYLAMAQRAVADVQDGWTIAFFNNFLSSS